MKAVSAVSQIRMMFEDFITPRTISQQSSAVHVVTARKGDAS